MSEKEKKGKIGIFERRLALLEWLEIIYNYITKNNKTCLTKYGVFTWKHLFKKEAQKQASQSQVKEQSTFYYIHL